jgi:hypothetical protein
MTPPKCENGHLMVLYTQKVKSKGKIYEYQRFRCNKCRSKRNYQNKIYKQHGAIHKNGSAPSQIASLRNLGAMPIRINTAHKESENTPG